MTKTINKAAPRVVDLKAAVSKLRGGTAEARTLAFMSIAPFAYSEDAGRMATINNLRVALGNKPNEVQTNAAKTQWIIGRVASRLPAGELPEANADASARITFAETIVLHYAAPAQDGKKANKLRKGQTGRRSPVQHKVIRAAETAWVLVAAELNVGGGETLAQKKAKAKAKAKRAPQMAGSSKGATPSHSELAKPAAPMTADDACGFLLAQSSTLLMYSNKNAALLPADFGVAVKAFRNAIVKADKARGLIVVKA